MKYSMIEEVLDNLNEAAGETYYYLCTDDGEILYHPRKAEIDRGFLQKIAVQLLVMQMVHMRFL